MKKSLLILSVLSLFIFLAACAGADSNTNPTNTSGSVGSDTVSNQGSESNEAVGSGEEPQLSDNFSGALTIPAQLALGTIQLEETELAVNSEQAADLLPLWQAYQTLSSSDNTAEVELEAVIISIEEAMNADQLAAISGMELTEDKMTALIESGELTFGGGGRGLGGNANQETSQRGFQSGGGPGANFPGGGGPGGGGPGGLGSANLSEDDLATRQAQFSENGPAQIQDRMLTGIVTRLLEDKMGIVSEGAQRGQIMSEAFSAVAEESGLTVEEIQAQLADGQTIAEVMQANGVELEPLQATLIDIFSEMPDMDELALEQSVANWLGVE